MEVVSLICIVIALGVFMYLSYKGVPCVLTAPLLAIFILITSGMPVVDHLFANYMTGASAFLKNYFFTFATGAVFAAIMGDSGMARSIGLKLSRVARKFKGHEKLAAIWCIPILSFCLSYGGVSVFVAFFTVIAVAKELFEEMDIPWRMYGVTSLGVAVLALTMAPGSPSVNNAIAANALGTNAMAAPVLGIIGCVLAIICGQIYFSWELHGIKKRDEHFLPTGADIQKVQFHDPNEPFEEMSLIFAVIPSVVLVIILNVLHQTVYVASFFAILVAIAMYWKRLKDKINTVYRGILQSMNAILIVALVVGLGSVIAATSGYQIILDALTRIPGPGYFQVIIAVNIAAGFTSSSSGGLTIALNSLGHRFIDPVAAGGLGLNPQIVHRLACISSGGLDSLPCNGTVLNELAQAKLTPKVGYRPQFVLSVVTPIIVVFILSILASFGVC